MVGAWHLHGKVAKMYLNKMQGNAEPKMRGLGDVRKLQILYCLLGIHKEYSSFWSTTAMPKARIRTQLVCVCLRVNAGDSTFIVA